MNANHNGNKVDQRQIREGERVTQEQRENRGKSIGSRDRSNANLRPFKKGFSGNPGGRPAGENLTETLRLLLQVVGADGRTNAEAIAEALIRSAKRGNIKAINTILERTEGKVPFGMRSEEGGPVKIVVEWVKKGLAGDG